LTSDLALCARWVISTGGVEQLRTFLSAIPRASAFAKAILATLELPQYAHAPHANWPLIDALVAMGEYATGSLLQALQDKDTRAQIPILTALGRIRTVQNIEPIIACLDERRFCVAAVTALQMIRNPEAVQPLIRCLEFEDVRTRKAAARALGVLRATEATDPLLRLLKDEDHYARRNAAEALGKIGSRHALEDLYVATQDRRKPVRSAATKAIEMIRKKKAP